MEFEHSLTQPRNGPKAPAATPPDPSCFLDSFFLLYRMAPRLSVIGITSCVSSDHSVLGTVGALVP